MAKNNKKNKKVQKKESSEDSQQEYEVEKILDKRIKHRKIEYLVKWLNYSREEATWEPISNMNNSMALVKEFEKNLKNSLSLSPERILPSFSDRRNIHKDLIADFDLKNKLENNKMKNKKNNNKNSNYLNSNIKKNNDKIIYDDFNKSMMLEKKRKGVNMFFQTPIKRINNFSYSDNFGFQSNISNNFIQDLNYKSNENNKGKKIGDLNDQNDLFYVKKINSNNLKLKIPLNYDNDFSNNKAKSSNKSEDLFNILIEGNDALKDNNKEENNNKNKSISVINDIYNLKKKENNEFNNRNKSIFGNKENESQNTPIKNKVNKNIFDIKNDIIKELLKDESEKKKEKIDKNNNKKIIEENNKKKIIEKNNLDKNKNFIIEKMGIEILKKKNNNNNNNENEEKNTLEEINEELNPEIFNPSKYEIKKILSVCKMENRIYYCVLANKKDENIEEKIIILGDDFKGEYQRLLIQYYESNVIFKGCEPDETIQE